MEPGCDSYPVDLKTHTLFFCMAYGIWVNKWKEHPFRAKLSQVWDICSMFFREYLP